MLPKWHIVLGAVFTFIIWQYINASYGNVIFDKSLLFLLSIIFLSSILIDVDHYIYYVFKKRDLNLRKAFNWFLEHRKEFERNPKPFRFVCHSIEFLSILAILSLYFNILFFIFLGFVFHLMTDLIYISIKEKLHLRGFSFLLYSMFQKKRQTKRVK